jgi:hypothetical protein
MLLSIVLEALRISLQDDGHLARLDLLSCVSGGLATLHNIRYRTLNPSRATGPPHN